MGAMRSCLAALAGALIILAALPAVAEALPAAVDEGMPAFDVSPGDSRLVVSNGNVTVWFMEYRPSVHIIAPAANGSWIGFTVSIAGLYEIDEQWHTAAFLDFNPPGPSPMHSGDWDSVTVIYDQTEESVDVSFSITGTEVLPAWTAGCWMQDGGRTADGLETAGNVSVSLVFHISAMTGFLKFDLAVDGWQWVNAHGDRLALAATVGGHEITDSFGGRPTADGVPVGWNWGNDTQLRYTVHSTYYRDSIRILASDLSELGYVTWSDSAVVTYGNGTSATASVSAYMFDCPAAGEETSHIALVFNVPEGREEAYSGLQYDPTIGIGPLLPAAHPDGGGSGWLGGALKVLREPAAIVLLSVTAAAVIAAVAVVLVRRRR